MNRSSRLKSDPAKVADWKRRSALKSNLARNRPRISGTGKVGNESSRTIIVSRDADRAKTGGFKRKPAKRIGPGRRMKAWIAVWAFLKPRLEAAGRTGCEFSFIPHVCSNVLTPAHSKKRREMKGNDVYAVAIACTTVHQILDERMTHSEMERAVMTAINNHGGLILP